MPRDAIDFSYARPSPADVARLNLDILVYTGPARPDRAYLDSMRAAGVAITLIQESDPNRSQQGYNAGVADAGYADSRADEVGYPLSASIAYVVSDGNAADPSTGGDAIAAYARGVQDASRRPFFFYGNQYATDHARAGANRALGSWVPSTWGTATLLRQEANIVSPIADTDYNTVHQDYSAWGQSGSPDTGEPFTVGQMDDIAQWEQDTRSIVLKVLVGDYDQLKDKGVLAQWENDTRAYIDKQIKASEGRIIAAIKATK